MKLLPQYQFVRFVKRVQKLVFSLLCVIFVNTNIIKGLYKGIIRPNIGKRPGRSDGTLNGVSRIGVALAIRKLVSDFKKTYLKENKNQVRSHLKKKTG